MKHYTYAYLREDRTPYYIGKGCGKRAWQHFKGEVRPPKDKSRILILKKNLSQDQAFRHEIYMIFVFGRKDIGTGILRNRTNGGEGNPGRKQTEETKRKIGDAHRGKTISKKSREKMSLARAGTTLSDAHKESISESLRGERNPNFGKTGPLSPLYGKRRNPESIEKMRQAALRRWERSEKDEYGRCVDAVKSAEKVNSKKDESGRSAPAVKTNSQVWQSTIDGFQSTAAGVASHNKANGWDPNARIKIS